MGTSVCAMSQRIISNRMATRGMDYLKRHIRTYSRSSQWKNEYLTNDGKVVGVWIFFRHGDRAPARPLSAPHRLDEESMFWQDRLPTPDLRTAFGEYSKFFPPDIHTSNNNGEFLDVRRFPFGFLTQRGLKQTRENGARLFNRYNRHGHHFPEIESYACSKDFLDVWDVKVYCTNYLRTVMSAQSFLDGLLGTKVYSNLCQQSRDNASADHIPRHSDIPIPHADEALLRVQVRGRDEDTLNAFDRNPDMMAELVSEVMSSQEFQDRDGKAAPLAARLANLLPGLARKNATPVATMPRLVASTG